MAIIFTPRPEVVKVYGPLQKTSRVHFGSALRDDVTNTGPSRLHHNIKERANSLNTRRVLLHCSQPPDYFCTTNNCRYFTPPDSEMLITLPDHGPDISLTEAPSATAPQKSLHPSRLSAPTGSTKYKQCTLSIVSRGSSSSLVKEGMFKRPSYTPAHHVHLPLPEPHGMVSHGIWHRMLDVLRSKDSKG